MRWDSGYNFSLHSAVWRAGASGACGAATGAEERGEGAAMLACPFEKQNRGASKHVGHPEVTSDSQESQEFPAMEDLDFICQRMNRNGMSKKVRSMQEIIQILSTNHAINLN